MRRLLALLAMVVGFLIGSAAAAAPPDIDDVLLTIKVRAMLYKDVELKNHNIGVMVVGRVATLFGPVSKIDVGLRAESLLRDMIELRDVRNELDVLESLPEFLPNALPPVPPGLEPRRRTPEAITPTDLRPALTMLFPVNRQSHP
jgi:hypothetical protein